MEFNEFKKKYQIYLDEMDINLTEKQFESFYKYMNLLIEWNEKINLTAIVEPDEIILKHFVDSIIVSKHISKGAKIIDVGTGAGFPGIPLKILREDIEVVLLDSLNKRIKFLDLIIEETSLNKIKAIHGRAEEMAYNREYREQFDVSISRAVANMATLSEYLIPFVKIGGVDISMKAGNATEEISNAKKAIRVLGGNINKIEEYKLPNTEIERTIIIVEKINSTPKAYPRKAGTPAKEPIN